MGASSGKDDSKVVTTIRETITTSAADNINDMQDRLDVVEDLYDMLLGCQEQPLLKLYA